MPLLVVAVITWRVAQGRKELVLRGRFLVFFVTYILVFSLASSSDLLIWNRNLTVFARKLPRNWLVPASWGDWRYRIVQKRAQDPRELIVVTMEEASGRSLEELRLEVAKLIKLAADKRAFGIAFDFYFNKDSNDVDSIIYNIVDSIDKSKTDIIIGFTLERLNGDILPLPTASVIEACLPIDQQGHLVGLVETDHVVRLIPLYFRWQKNRPSLSLKVAQSLAEIEGTELKIPADGLLRFIEPKDAIRQVSYKELADPNKRALMRQSWVLVGEKSNTDTFF